MRAYFGAAKFTSDFDFVETLTIKLNDSISIKRLLKVYILLKVF